MIKGYLNYAQMLQVFNLVLFSLTFGSAMLDFSEFDPKSSVKKSNLGDSTYYAKGKDGSEGL